MSGGWRGFDHKQKTPWKISRVGWVRTVFW